MLRIGAWFATLLAVVFSAGPFVWQLLTSLRPENELTRLGWPHALSLDSYRRVFEGQPLGRVMLNSVVVAGATAALCLAAGALAAFAVAKLPFRGRKVLLVVALAVSMFPPIAYVCRPKRVRSSTNAAAATTMAVTTSI